MAYTGKVTAFSLNDTEHKEAVEIVDTIAEKKDWSGRQTAAHLIIQAGKARAKRIKERNPQSDKI